MSKQEDMMIRELKSLEVNPPSGLWNDIDSTLKARNRKRIITITSWASAASIALLFSIAGYFTLQKGANVLTQTKPITLPSQSQSNTTIKENLIKNNTASNTQKEVEKSRAILTPNSITSAGSSVDPTQKISQTEQEKSNIPQKIDLIEQAKLRGKGVVQERLNLNTSIEDKNSAFLAISDVKESKPRGNWYLSASGFPIYSYHSAGVTNKAGAERQSGISSFGGAISVRYEFRNRISIETGLSLGFMGQKEKNLYLSNYKNPSITVLSNDEYTNNYGTLTASNSDYTIAVEAPVINRISHDVSIYKIDALQKFRYLEIPLLIAKNFNYKKINLFVKGGLSAGVLVQNLLNLKGQNISLKGKTTGVDKFVSTAITSVGASIPLFKSANLIIEPSLKLGLKPLKHSTTKSYPFSSYIKFGVEIPI